jgi:tetratricopeptide (TPR) repeat protein
LNGAIDDCTKAIQIDPKLTAAYYNRGDARSEKKDFDGAITDFTKVVELRPDDAEAYYNRGYAREQKQDLDGAIGDYTLAIQTKPTLDVAYNQRGTLRSIKGDEDRAIADFNKAIELNPASAGTYYNRGLAKNHKKDLSAALADFTTALELDPKLANAYNDRTWVNLYLHRGEPTYLDAAKFLELRGTSDSQSPYMVIVACLGMAESNKADATKTFLEQWVKQFDPSAWTTQIMRYLQGSLDETQLLALATDNGKKTEAHAYIGMAVLLAGKKSAALEHLRWVRENGEKTFYEFNLVNYELQRLAAASSKSN